MNVISEFVSKHHLPANFIHTATRYFLPVAERLSKRASHMQEPLVLGLVGCQGSGKSTLAGFLQAIFESRGLAVVNISLDDFYLTRAQRKTLAETVHPLLQTRGVPGTHDYELLLEVLSSLKNNRAVSIPRFDKSTDDRVANSAWDDVTGPVDIVILEGWCMGAEPQAGDDLREPVNALEAREDTDGRWRAFVNNETDLGLGRVNAEIDYWLMLKAPSFDSVYNWRLQQEHALRERLQAQGKLEEANGLMSDEEVARFILYYQRITQQLLLRMPAKADVVWGLGNDRSVQSLGGKDISRFEQHNSTKGPGKEKFIIFTDLDGTLLDHTSYDFSDAIPAIDQCKDLGIPVIPTTSKTRAELLVLRERLALESPFIVENGAAIFWPDSCAPQAVREAFERWEDQEYQGPDLWVKCFAPKRAYWQSFLLEHCENFSGEFRSFSQLGLTGIRAATGLDEPSAAMANQRDFSEPLLWEGSQERLQEFAQVVSDKGFELLIGGRFAHLTTGYDKGKALEWLCEFYQRNFESFSEARSIALGDSGNDIAMLECADYAVVVRSPVHAFPSLERKKGIVYSQEYGPRGWNKQVLELIKSSN